MSESTKTKDTKTSHLDKVRVDLDDCQRALSSWYVDSSLNPTEAEETLHRATEALLRAVSTLTLIVESEQSS